MSNEAVRVVNDAVWLIVGLVMVGPLPTLLIAIAVWALT